MTPEEAESAIKPEGVSTAMRRAADALKILITRAYRPATGRDKPEPKIASINTSHSSKETGSDSDAISLFSTLGGSLASFTLKSTDSGTPPLITHTFTVYSH